MRHCSRCGKIWEGSGLSLLKRSHLTDTCMILKRINNSKETMNVYLCDKCIESFDYWFNVGVYSIDVDDVLHEVMHIDKDYFEGKLSNKDMLQDLSTTADSYDDLIEAAEARTLSIVVGFDPEIEVLEDVVLGLHNEEKRKIFGYWLCEFDGMYYVMKDDYYKLMFK